MPDRIIRERARTSPTLDQLSDGAERLFWRLVVVADDYGRFDANPLVVRAMTFPLRNEKRLRALAISSWMKELVAVDAVRLYTAKERWFGYFPGWFNSQRHRDSLSKFPPPPGGAVAVPERKVHDALFVVLKGLAEFCGQKVVAVERNVRSGNGFADIVMTVVGGRIVIELKRTRADAGAIRQVSGYVEHLKGAIGGMVFATGMGPGVSAEDFRRADIALIGYDVKWVASVLVASGLTEGWVALPPLPVPADEDIARPPDDFTRNRDDFTRIPTTPGDGGRETRAEGREPRGGQNARGEPLAAPDREWNIPESITKALARCPFLGASRDVQSPVYWRAAIRAHPAVDFPRELLKAEEWCTANRERAPKKRLAAFLSRWFSRVDGEGV